MGHATHLIAIVAWVSVAFTSISVAASDSGFLGLPIACHLGQDCWVAQYADHGSGETVEDFACGNRTYDRHEGTDFAIRDFVAMASGVPVVAAAAGTVARLRDGMPDRQATAENRSMIADRECGNGVVLKHEDGLETQYCHLRRGSIVVRPGALVAAGETLGLVGLSGMTEFPHVHLTVRHEGKVIDPFVGLARDAACGPGHEPLWKASLADDLAYSPFVIYHAGFADRKVKAVDVRSGALNATTLSRSAPMLALWADIFGLAKDDVIAMRLIGPDGSILVESEHRLARDQALHFRLIGRRLTSDAWPAGNYRGEITVRRTEGISGTKLEEIVERTVILQ